MADSLQFARAYGIDYPLLADTDGSISRAFTGIDGADVTVPGVVVVRDGKIVFRQIATGKDDRLSAAQLIAEVDRALGKTGTAVRGGYAVYERLQLRVEAGGGVDESSRGVVTGALAALYPLHRYVVAGPWVQGNLRDGFLDLDAALGLRVPVLADTGAITLTATGGWTVIDATGPNAGGRIGAWLALDPTWAVHLDAGFTARRLDDDPYREAFVTLGVSRLVRARSR